MEPLEDRDRKRVGVFPGREEPLRLPTVGLNPNGRQPQRIEWEALRTVRIDEGVCAMRRGPSMWLAASRLNSE